MKTRLSSVLRPTLVAAGLALPLVACPPPEWQLDAPPPKAPAAGARGVVFTVESSQLPAVHVGAGESSTAIASVDPNAPASSVPFFVPGGLDVKSVSIGSVCDGGCSCEPPPGAFVRVTNVREVDAWKLTAPISTATTTVKRGSAQSARVRVFATSQAYIDVAAARGTDPRAKVIYSSLSGSAATDRVDGRGLRRRQPMHRARRRVGAHRQHRRPELTPRARHSQPTVVPFACASSSTIAGDSP